MWWTAGQNKLPAEVPAEPVFLGETRSSVWPAWHVVGHAVRLIWATFRRRRYLFSIMSSLPLSLPLSLSISIICPRSHFLQLSSVHLDPSLILLTSPDLAYIEVSTSFLLTSFLPLSLSTNDKLFPDQSVSHTQHTHTGWIHVTPKSSSPTYRTSEKKQRRMVAVRSCVCVQTSVLVYISVCLWPKGSCVFAKFISSSSSPKSWGPRLVPFVSSTMTA